MNDLVGSLLNDVGIAASVVIIGDGVLGVCRGGIGLYRRTIVSRRDLARRLNQLAAGVTLRYVEERFGTPTFVRTLVPAPVPAVPAQRRPLVRELVQVLADPNAAAGAHSRRRDVGRMPIKSPTIRICAFCAPGMSCG